MIWLYWLLLVRWVWKLYNFFVTLSAEMYYRFLKSLFMFFYRFGPFVSRRANFFLSFRFSFWFKKPKIIFLSFIWSGTWLSIYFFGTTFIRCTLHIENYRFGKMKYICFNWNRKKEVFGDSDLCQQRTLWIWMIENSGREKFSLLSSDVDLWPQTSMALIQFLGKHLSLNLPFFLLRMRTPITKLLQVWLHFNEMSEQVLKQTTWWSKVQMILSDNGFLMTKVKCCSQKWSMDFSCSLKRNRKWIKWNPRFLRWK